MLPVVDAPHLPDPIAWAIPVFFVAMVAEMLWARARAPESYEPRDTLTSLLLGFGSGLAGLLTAGAVTLAAFWAYDHRVTTIPFVWWAWIACFVIDDFRYFLYHWLSHRSRWFWASHVNHHSSQHYNLSTALRQTWTGFFVGSFLFQMPLFFLGFHPVMVAFCWGLNLIYQFWIHTEAIGRMPRWFEAVMNTPSHHRVHHATNPRYLDRNYAGVFIIWDRLFRTFEPERDEDRPHYGIVRQLGSFNLIWNVFHEWAGIARDVWSAPWGSKFAYVWREPGWSHDDSRDTSNRIRARWAESAMEPAERE